MGVRNNKIFIYGAEVPYGTMDKLGEDAWEKYELSWGKNGDIGFISDGMGGKYEVFGMLIEMYDEEYDFFPEGIIDLGKLEEQLVKKDLSKEEDNRIKVMKAAKKLIGKPIVPHLMFINHYS